MNTVEQFEPLVLFNVWVLSMQLSADTYINYKIYATDALTVE